MPPEHQVVEKLNKSRFGTGVWHWSLALEIRFGTVKNTRKSKQKKIIGFVLRMLARFQS